LSGSYNYALSFPTRRSSDLAGVFISNRGLKVPAVEGASLDFVLGGLALAIIGILVAAHWGKKRQEATGRVFPLGRLALALLIGLPVAGWLVSGASLSLQMPELKGFNFSGGLTMSPEFAALLAGLVIYTSAFIAEVVRSGIQAVNQGQWEAAGS